MIRKVFQSAYYCLKDHTDCNENLWKFLLTSKSDESDESGINIRDRNEQKH